MPLILCELAKVLKVGNYVLTTILGLLHITSPRTLNFDIPNNTPAEPFSYEHLMVFIFIFPRRFVWRVIYFTNYLQT